jgi:hypothetical protein
VAAARPDAEEAIRQTIIEKSVEGKSVEMDAIEIADRAGRVLAVVDFDPIIKPSSSAPTKQ